jgi:hypothetical protein
MIISQKLVEVANRCPLTGSGIAGTTFASSRQDRDTMNSNLNFT